jgi:choline dehydrogenase-like flavoprotein
VIQSPQILELSGIGSSSLLKKHGIETIINNPNVGENLQDHAIAGVSFESAIPTFDSFRGPKVAAAVFAEYKDKKPGPMAFATYSAAFTPCMPLLQNPNELQKLLDEHLKHSPQESPA